MCRPRYTCVTVRMYVADHVVLGNVTGYWDMMGQQGRIHEFFGGGVLGGSSSRRVLGSKSVGIFIY